MIDDDLLKKAVLESYASIADQIDPSQEEKEKQDIKSWEEIKKEKVEANKDYVDKAAEEKESEANEG